MHPKRRLPPNAAKCVREHAILPGSRVPIRTSSEMHKWRPLPEHRRPFPECIQGLSTRPCTWKGSTQEDSASDAHQWKQAIVSSHQSEKIFEMAFFSFSFPDQWERRKLSIKLIAGYFLCISRLGCHPLCDQSQQQQQSILSIAFFHRLGRFLSLSLPFGRMQ